MNIDWRPYTGGLVLGGIVGAEAIVGIWGLRPCTSRETTPARFGQIDWPLASGFGLVRAGQTLAYNRSLRRLEAVAEDREHRRNWDRFNC